MKRNLEHFIPIFSYVTRIQEIFYKCTEIIYCCWASIYRNTLCNTNNSFSLTFFSITSTRSTCTENTWDLSISVAGKEERTVEIGTMDRDSWKTKRNWRRGGEKGWQKDKRMEEESTESNEFSFSSAIMPFYREHRSRRCLYMIDD